MTSLTTERVRSHPGPREVARGVLTGLLAGARHEHRQHVRRVRAVFAGAGQENLARPVVTAVWAVLALVTVLGALAPSVREALPAGVERVVPVGLLLVVVAVCIGLSRHCTAVVSQRRVLFLTLPVGTRTGLLAGLSHPYVPAAVVLVNQVARGGLTGLPASAAAVADGGTRWATGADSDEPAWTVLALVVVLGSALATACASRWVGRHGLGPRVPSAHRWAGRMVLLVLAGGWVLAAVLGTISRLDTLGQHALLAAPFLVTLMLRVRHVRFMSPESLGHGLLLAAHAGADPRRISRTYRRNALVLLAPAHVGSAALLALHGSAVVIVLLVGLAVFESALDAVIVQRATVVLPASGLAFLFGESRSALAAVLCLAVVFAAAGSAGLSTGLDLAHRGGTVVGASVLLVTAALALTWVVRLDAPRWLPSLHATLRSTR